ncbi:MAG: DUF99 family protein [Nitrososphaerota archaeon]|nr:DUF99 family protein [Nitrososphaerota archaeon]MCL5672290.1 DUF99 family protein [Nitrososphaerota archaeon]MDG6912331.1 DUF99 family protein [Nitrososphaerota archaeon]MDG6937410.1 DUF99 family protein [Nitrososphaerota archaeon]MDG6958642.1 DUF99 family protein [Nitrososphaerota archaeon]
MRLHLNKPGIRALGVAESFREGQRASVLAGVVMRSDFVIDGVALGRTEVGGDDATKSIVGLFRRLHRNDINVVLVSGAILSLYNIVDVDALSERTGTPVICLTYKETSGIEGAIRRHFPEGAEGKLEAYRRLGRRAGVKLGTGHRVFVRSAGLDGREAKSVLDAFTLQGSVPEPVKVAKLLARAAMAWRS